MTPLPVKPAIPNCLVRAQYLQMGQPGPHCPSVTENFHTARIEEADG